ncbi:SRPBCC family protein [Pseudonocardia sp. HH130629-09]|uniref:SRPBCC family protein n=1 Tax=Pseudonocardia sp. HH130629-09 TaxID=1641402 RepID=UPI0006CB42D7|nr:SRPBCC family protein [Pseudonocardia sp. HH130629-09]ALE85870.1 polyketide cyclase [Pseudonocardia sp. HH130629-09]
MTDTPPTVVRSSRTVAADPARQPSWDGNNNLAEAAPGQRVHAVGDVFSMLLTQGTVRENRVVEFTEGRLVAWLLSEPPPGHLWRWELEPVDDATTRVTCTYDWTGLDPDDAFRQKRARATTADMLRASLDRLAVVAEKM